MRGFRATSPRSPSFSMRTFWKSTILVDCPNVRFWMIFSSVFILKNFPWEILRFMEYLSLQFSHIPALNVFQSMATISEETSTLPLILSSVVPVGRFFFGRLLLPEQINSIAAVSFGTKGASSLLSLTITGWKLAPLFLRGLLPQIRLCFNSKCSNPLVFSLVPRSQIWWGRGKQTLMRRMLSRSLSLWN